MHDVDRYFRCKSCLIAVALLEIKIKSIQWEKGV